MLTFIWKMRMKVISHYDSTSRGTIIVEGGVGVWLSCEIMKVTSTMTVRPLIILTIIVEGGGGLLAELKIMIARLS